MKPSIVFVVIIKINKATLYVAIDKWFFFTIENIFDAY